MDFYINGVGCVTLEEIEGVIKANAPSESEHIRKNYFCGILDGLALSLELSKAEITDALSPLE